jgi:site-specific recombinase XerD
MRVATLREIAAKIGDYLPGLRDRALLLLAFTDAFRRSELAPIAIAHIKETEHGLSIKLSWPKGDRTRAGMQVGIRYGTKERALPGAGAAALARGPRHRRHR